MSGFLQDIKVLYSTIKYYISEGTIFDLQSTIFEVKSKKSIYYISQIERYAYFVDIRLILFHQ